MRYIIIIFFILAAGFMQAEPYFGGEMKFTKAWYMFEDSWEVSQDNYHLVDLYVRNEMEELDFKARFQVRIWDNDDLQNTRDLQAMANLAVYEILPWEIWVKINDIPFKRLNLTIGKQYFEWGTADGIHPTSVLNPDDLSNPLAMDAKIPVNAINLNYYISTFKLFLIWIPALTPAKMPRYFPLYDYQYYQLPDTELLEITDTIKKPGQLPDGMSKAVKMAVTVLDIDLSAGYFHGYDYMPIDKELTYSLTGNMLSQFNLHITQTFPQLDVYTFDFTTSIEGFGLWSEVGIYDYPETITLIHTPLGDEENILYDGDPYATYVLGSDYSFPSGFYFNLQYAYGLPLVRGKDLLEDYFILSCKDSYLSGLLEIELANIFGFNRKISARDNHEVMLTQSVKSLHINNVEIGLIVTEIYARGDVMFNAWQKYDMLEVYVKYFF